MLKNKRDKIYNNISLKDRLLQSNTYLPPAWMDINVFNFLLSFGKTCKSANVMTSRWRRHASRRRFWFDWSFKRRKKSSFVDFLLKFSAKRTFVMQISNRSRRSIATRDFAIPTLSMPTPFPRMRWPEWKKIQSSFFANQRNSFFSEWILCTN